MTYHGNVVKEVTYDSFGTILHDSNKSLYPEGISSFFGAHAHLGFADGDTNLYGHVLGDTVNFIDPLGLLTLPDSPSGDKLEWHPGQQGKPGWRGKDHWHHNKGKEHLLPGTEVPDPICKEFNADMPILATPSPWWALFPLLIPFVGPLYAP